MPEEHPFFEWLKEHFEASPWREDEIRFEIKKPEWRKQVWQSTEGYNPSTPVA